MSTRSVCGIAAFFGVCVLIAVLQEGEQARGPLGASFSDDFVGAVLVVGAILCVAVLAVKCLTDEWIWRQ